MTAQHTAQEYEILSIKDHSVILLSTYLRFTINLSICIVCEDRIVKLHWLRFYLLIKFQISVHKVSTVKPGLRGHLGDQKKWSYILDRWHLKRGSIHMKYSMTGQERWPLKTDGCLLEVNIGADLTVYQSRWEIQTDNFFSSLISMRLTVYVR